MATQNNKNHIRLIPIYHGVLLILLLTGLVGSIINLINSTHETLYSASLISLLFVACLIQFFKSRGFSLRAQDRAIRAEENLRHYIMTGKALDSRLRMPQIIALRFAPDEEFVELADMAAENSMSRSEIKQAIKNWKADHDRA